MSKMLSTKIFRHKTFRNSWNYERTKFINNNNTGIAQVKDTEKIFIKIKEEKFPKLKNKSAIKVQEACR